MELLLALQSIRTPLLDRLMLAVTALGEEAPMIAICCLLYWCVNKRLAQALLFNFFAGGVINAALKIGVCAPRPWLRDSRLSPVSLAVEGATGFSFPSGHTATAVAGFGTLALFCKRHWVTALCVLLMLLIGFSRLYLGVHMPQDVLVSLLIGALLLACVQGLMPWMERNDALAASIGSLMAILLIAFALVRGEDALYDDALKIGGAALGLFVGWLIERRFVRFDTRAPWMAQLFKYAAGMALVALVLVCPLPGGMRLMKSIRYFALVMLALCGWPAVFKRMFGRKRDG